MKPLPLLLLPTPNPVDDVDGVRRTGASDDNGGRDIRSPDDDDNDEDDNDVSGRSGVGSIGSRGGGEDEPEADAPPGDEGRESSSEHDDEEGESTGTGLGDVRRDDKDDRPAVLRPWPLPFVASVSVSMTASGSGSGSGDDSG